MQLLFLVPVFVSVVLGTLFLWLSSARPALKLAVSVTFLLAGYLQFFSRFVLTGLLLQIALGLALLLWRRFDSSR